MANASVLNKEILKIFESRISKLERKVKDLELELRAAVSAKPLEHYVRTTSSFDANINGSFDRESEFGGKSANIAVNQDEKELTATGQQQKTQILSSGIILEKKKKSADTEEKTAINSGSVDETKINIFVYEKQDLLDMKTSALKAVDRNKYNLKYYPITTILLDSSNKEKGSKDSGDNKDNWNSRDSRDQTNNWDRKDSWVDSSSRDSRDGIRDSSLLLKRAVGVPTSLSQQPTPMGAGRVVLLDTKAQSSLGSCDKVPARKRGPPSVLGFADLLREYEPTYEELQQTQKEQSNLAPVDRERDPDRY